MFTAVTVSVHAEDYRFTVDPECDSIVVYDKNDNAVLKYSKQTILLQGNPVTQTKVGKTIVFSDASGEIGTVLSKNYKKIQMLDGNVYKRKLYWKKLKLSYTKDGEICATARYSFDKGFWRISRHQKAIVEMNTSDAKFVPILFFSILAHMQGTIATEEQMLWLNTFTFLY
jgi:hypothetical protein